MAKFSGGSLRYSVAPTSPVATVSAAPDTVTSQGSPGWTRTPKSDLFLLAVTNMVGEDTFYEGASERDARFRDLIAQVVAEDPSWVARFVPYLRNELNLRSASIVMAAEYTLTLRKIIGEADPSTPPIRTVVADAMRRADEPAEFVAYWRHRTGGKGMPGGVQRGVADAAVRLFTERAALKYDGAARSYRMGDVLALARPKPSAPWQAELFRYLLDRRHGRDIRADLTSLPTIAANLALDEIPRDERRAFLASAEAQDRLKVAGFTWEELSGWLGGAMTQEAWEAIIPSMGYMALLRNVRNFDQAGVRDEVALQVAARLADPEEVAKSRQLPMRFLSAYRAAPSLRWSYPLEVALTAALGNIPALGGRTLVLVDTSSSMNAAFSKDGSLMRWDAATVFGIALGQRSQVADVVSFSSAQRYWGDPSGANTKAFPLAASESLLRSVQRWTEGGYFLGGGTDTAGAVQRHYAGHDRVVIVTDEQAGTGDPTRAVPAHVPVYTWNLAGYGPGHAPSGVGNRHVFGGLSDAAFRMIPLLEAGKSQTWPF